MLTVRRISFIFAFVLVFIALVALGVPSVRAAIRAFLGLGISPAIPSFNPDRFPPVRCDVLD